MEGIIFDPQVSGCAGDMFVSALVDLTGDKNTIQDVVTAINTLTDAEVAVDFETRVVKGISSTKMNVYITKDVQIHHGVELLGLALDVAKELNCSAKGVETIQRAINLLLEAESVVHGSTREHVHLHETASLDTILDIVGTVTILERNNLLEVQKIGLPVNTGSGTITIAHGKVSVPAPAVSKILEITHYPAFSDGIKGEMLTPTGAILLSTLVTTATDYLPPHIVKAIGYGAGSKEFPDRANAFKVMKVQFSDEIDLTKHTMLETHLDDVSGEILGGVIEKLLSQGALDVSYYPIFMKKNRPGYNLRVICKDSDAKELALTMMKETGTLGVRITRTGRFEAKRILEEHKVTINNREFSCKIKKRLIGNRVIGFKPEFEDIKKISEATNLPLITIEKIVLEQIRSTDVQ